MYGITNAFVVNRIATVNGVNLVFGTLRATISFSASAAAAIAYFATNLYDSNVDNRGILSDQQSVLLPDCSLLARTAQSTTPCAVNIYDSKATPTFGLFRSQGQLDAYAMGYWGSSARDPWTTIKKRAPALETMVLACASSPTAPTSFNCSGGPDWLKNYYSPLPGFAPLVEVAVTPVTQNAGCGAGQYKAPHAPFGFKSSDYDGHRMGQYDFFERRVRDANKGSNRRAECFRAQSGTQAGALLWSLGASAASFDPA
eukprot:CAMPEP_0113688790 /NCGR_PEP_ID=MMETSP0038_2-20120614/16753_1 /TAXON_ID=2898 /ORGANISM="Cryptomonas paramecium" /LENGTH=256 /DNA_ID=CAMNT_0000609687 /DNA_START=406 /DNA_END=1172 /DNA_ORIENTATION=+ /assembly_acc=CAM_ASM_000170